MNFFYDKPMEELVPRKSMESKYPTPDTSAEGCCDDCTTPLEDEKRDEAKSYLKTHTLNLLGELIKREEVIGFEVDNVPEIEGWNKSKQDTLSYLKEQRDLVANKVK